MLLDIIRLYNDFHIPVAPSHHKHTRRGWANTVCPFHQGSAGGYHLGYNLMKGYFFCFGCGWHPPDLTIQALTQSDKVKTKKILLAYTVNTGLVPEDIPNWIPPDQLKWPEGYGPMTNVHKSYLRERGFNPDRLEKEWGLMGTGNWGAYSFRVIAPIIFKGESVSWQGRDITDKQKAKYLPCPKEQEILPHKHVLYGFDKARWRTVVVVEGITGVWRLGPGAVGTFGVEYTSSQLLLLAQTFAHILLLNDGDEAGQDAADRMAIELTGEGKEVELLEPIGCDSGDMPDRMADEIMKEVRK